MTPEGDLVAACLGLLAYCDVYAWRSNTGAVRAEYKGKTRFIRYGVVGSPDIIGIDRRGRFWGIECKVGRNKATAAQECFLARIREYGGVGIIVRPDDYDTLIRHYAGQL